MKEITFMNMQCIYKPKGQIIHVRGVGSMSEDEGMDLYYGGFATSSSDPVIAWFTQEGCKRGRRNLMWDICLELREEFETIHEERKKLRDDVTVTDQ